MQEQATIDVQEQDVKAFFARNPMALAQVRIIALQRMLRERDAEIARIKDGVKPMQPIADMPKEG